MDLVIVVVLLLLTVIFPVSSLHSCVPPAISDLNNIFRPADVHNLVLRVSVESPIPELG